MLMRIRHSATPWSEANKAKTCLEMLQVSLDSLELL